MKKLLLMVLLAAAAVTAWKFSGNSHGSDPLDVLEQRLHAAEGAYQSAGRAAGLSGVDTSSNAEAAIAELGRVEQELRERARSVTSPEVKDRIHRLMEEAATVRRKIG